jgi:hypothetical protein
MCYFKKSKNKSKARKGNKGHKGGGGNGNSRQRRKQKHDISEEQKAFITSSILNKRRLFIYVE